MFNAATFSWLSSIKTMAYEAAKAAMACLFCRKKGRRLGWRAFCIECVNIKERQKNNNNMYNDLIRLAKDYKKISVANLLKDIKNKSKKLTKLKSKDNLDKLIGFGQLLLKGGDQQHAIQVFSVVLELEPQHFIAMTYVAAIFEDVGQHQQALPLYTQAFESNQNNLNLASRVAWCQFKIGQHESGLGLMEKLISIKPDDVGYHQITAEMLFELGEHQVARELIITFLARQFDINLCLTLAKHYFEVKDFASAVELFRSVTEKFPNNAIYESYLAYSLASDHQYEESRAWALRSLRKDKTQIKAWNALGFYHFSLKANFEKAKRYYQKVLDREPNDVECLVNVGFMAQNQRQFDNAESFYRRVERLEPINREIKENLALIYRENCLFKKYFQYFENRNKVLPEVLTKKAHLIWNGTDTLKDKSVLILDEQGLGDLYYESWYFYYLENEDITATVAVDSRTLPIFKDSFKSLNFIDSQDERAISELNFDILVFRSSLGLLYWRQVYSIGLNIYSKKRMDPAFFKHSWLKVKNDTPKKLVGLQPQIGISWRSGLNILGRSMYYFSAEDFVSTLQKVDGQFINLQYSIEQSETKTLKATLCSSVSFPEFDLKNDQYELAKVICELDLVVSTCNAVLALANMLGVPSIWVSPTQKATMVYDTFDMPTRITQTRLDLNLDDDKCTDVLNNLIHQKLESKPLSMPTFDSFNVELLFEHCDADYSEQAKINYMLETNLLSIESLSDEESTFKGEKFWQALHWLSVSNKTPYKELFKQFKLDLLIVNLDIFCLEYFNYAQWKLFNGHQVIQAVFSYLSLKNADLSRYKNIVSWIAANDGLE